jgi:hypothetical protein
MQKHEGVAFPPLPLVRPPRREAILRGPRRRLFSEPRCRMCGAPVITSHGKTVCLRCGFMTGCSEGI